MTENKVQPEKFDLQSLDIAEDKRQELLRLFPEVRGQHRAMRPADQRGAIGLDTTALEQAQAVTLDAAREIVGGSMDGGAPH